MNFLPPVDTNPSIFYASPTKRRPVDPLVIPLSFHLSTILSAYIYIYIYIYIAVYLYTVFHVDLGGSTILDIYTATKVKLQGSIIEQRRDKLIRL